MSSLHEVVKAEALGVLHYLLEVACVANGIQAPKKSEIVQLNGVVGPLAQTIFDIYVCTLSMDDERTCVAAACEGIQGVLQQVGLAALHLTSLKDGSSLAERLMQALLVLLTEKAPCQVAAQLEEEDEDADHDNVVIDGVTDVISELSKVCIAALYTLYTRYTRYTRYTLYIPNIATWKNLLQSSLLPNSQYRLPLMPIRPTPLYILYVICPGHGPLLHAVLRRL